LKLVLIQILLLNFSLIASCAFLLIVFMISFKNKMNQLFSFYLFFQICWIVSGIGMRFSLAHQNIKIWNNEILTPSLWLTLTGLFLILMTIFLYRFTCFFVNKNNRLVNSIFILLNIIMIGFFIIHLHTPLFYNPHLNVNGFITVDFHWLGLAGSSLFNLVWIVSLVNLWKARHMDGVNYLILSILIYGGGILLGASRFIAIPTVPIAILISNVFLGHVIVCKRIISPLREKSIKLEHEILKRMKLERNIHSVKEDRTILLSELHHRVRNNLQIISSLAHFHSGYLQTYSTPVILNRFQDLMQSMAFVHDYIYGNNDLNKINFSNFINELINKIRMIGYKSDTLMVRKNIKSKNFPFDKAIPCGIVLYELILNVYKHAFPEHYKGKPVLDIEVRSLKSDAYEITVQDNGIGLPENFNLNNINSIGLKLVKILIEGQLGGSMEVAGERGTVFRLLF